MIIKLIAKSVSDFNETDWKQFATRIGNKWVFDIPSEEMQNLEALLPNHVLGVQSVYPGPAQEIMLGRLVKK
jgi:hypothetical protein